MILLRKVGPLVGEMLKNLSVVRGKQSGGLAGKGVAEAIDPTVENAYWEKNYRNQPYYESGHEYSDYEPAYRAGYTSYATDGRAGRKFEFHGPGRKWRQQWRTTSP